MSVQSRWSRATVVGSVGVASLALALVAALPRPEAAAAPALVEVMVEASEHQFVPDVIEASPGEAISLTLTNAGRAPHDIVFELEAGRVVTTTIIRGDETASAEFDAPPIEGEYVYYCSVGDHRELGMEGTLIVSDQPSQDFEVVVDDLLNPRGLDLAGSVLLISEGGTGQPDPMTFVPGDNNGRVTRVTLGGTELERSVVIDGLTNAVDQGGGVVGANHSVWRTPGMTSETALVALSGGDGHPDPKAQILAGEPGMPFAPLIDLWAFEEEHNPDGANVDSNPWRILHGPDGMIYISDAGANSIVKADPETGEASLYAVFEPVGMRDTGSPISAVPTGMAFDPADPGVMYVALLGSFDPGAAQVRRLEDLDGDGDVLEEGENTLHADGFTTADDLAFSPDGRLFVLQFGGFAAQGSLVEVGSDNPVSVDGLFAASAVVFDASGDALVAVGTGESGFVTDRVVRIPASMLTERPTPTATATEGGPSPTPTDGPSPTPTDGPSPTPTEGRWYIYLPQVETVRR